jgi:hypothetical protein
MEIQLKSKGKESEKQNIYKEIGDYCMKAAKIEMRTYIKYEYYKKANNYFNYCIESSIGNAKCLIKQLRYEDAIQY